MYIFDTKYSLVKEVVDEIKALHCLLNFPRAFDDALGIGIGVPSGINNGANRLKLHLKQHHAYELRIRRQQSETEAPSFLSQSAFCCDSLPDDPQAFSLGVVPDSAGTVEHHG